MMTADRLIKKGMHYMRGDMLMVMHCYYPARCMVEAKAYPRASQLNNQRTVLTPHERK